MKDCVYLDFLFASGHPTTVKLRGGERRFHYLDADLCRKIFGFHAVKYVATSF